MVGWLREAAPFLLWGTGFLLLAGLAKAAVDIMSHQPDNNIFMNWGPWWDNRISWQRKYRKYATDLRPRFPGAKTVLVLVTDFWHLADFLYLRFYWLAGGVSCAGLALARAPWYGYVLAMGWAACVLGAVFELTYRRYFRIRPVAE